LRLLVVWLICALVTSLIAAAKGRSWSDWFLLGCVLGPVGIVVISLKPAIHRRAPKRVPLTRAPVLVKSTPAVPVAVPVEPLPARALPAGGVPRLAVEPTIVEAAAPAIATPARVQPEVRARTPFATVLREGAVVARTQGEVDAAFEPLRRQLPNLRERVARVVGATRLPIGDRQAHAELRLEARTVSATLNRVVEIVERFLADLTFGEAASAAPYQALLVTVTDLASQAREASAMLDQAAQIPERQLSV
jgi:hypothetical protein